MTLDSIGTDLYVLVIAILIFFLSFKWGRKLLGFIISRLLFRVIFIALVVIIIAYKVLN